MWINALFLKKIILSYFLMYTYYSSLLTLDDFSKILFYILRYKNFEKKLTFFQVT